jgi:hypothetical protein
MKKIFLSIFSLFLFIGYGCNLDQTNINPNSPTQVPLNTLLPPAQAQLANVLGGAVFRYTNIFSSHARGAFAQELDIENYNPSKTFVGYVGKTFTMVRLLTYKPLLHKPMPRNRRIIVV